MKAFALAVALILTASASIAQTAPPVPPVFPIQAGSVGTGFRVGAVPAGNWIGWKYQQRNMTHTYVACALTGYEIIHPDTSNLTPLESARAYWRANVQVDCSTEPSMATIYADAMRVMATVPAN